MKNSIQIGLFGLGTVGKDVVSLLSDKHNPITEQLGSPVKISKVVVAHPEKDRGFDTSSLQISKNPGFILDDSELDLVVELTGDKVFADSIISSCLNRGTPIVTANKALLAEKLLDILHTARSSNTPIGYEACVGSGIPFLRFLRDGLSVEQISGLTGIFNSSTNLILSLMQEYKYDFAQALEIADQRGYTEPDPHLDIHGYDTAHKLCIVSTLSFYREVLPEIIPIQGISGLTFLDLQIAEKSGYKVKLVGQAQRNEENLSAWVGPTYVPKDHPLAAVSGIDNGLVISGKYTNTSFVQGRGAGRYNAALGVLNDIVQIMKPNSQEIGIPRCDSRHSETPRKNREWQTCGGKTEYIIRIENRSSTSRKVLLNEVFKKFHINTIELIDDSREHTIPENTDYLKTTPCTWQEIQAAMNDFRMQTSKKTSIQIFRILKPL